MTKLSNVAVVALLVAAVSLESKAALITFELFPARPVALEDSATGFLVVDGLTAHFSVNSGFMNSTAGSWGINADGAGDNTDELDGVNVAESLTITFSRDVDFASITLHSVGGVDSLQLVMGMNSPVVVGATGTTAFSDHNFIATGQSLVISHRTGNGISLDAFAVEASAVPEASAAMMLMVGCGGGLFARMWQQARRTIRAWLSSKCRLGSTSCRS